MGKQQKTEGKKKEERKRERLNNVDNNGQATHGARKHAWRTQAAWAKIYREQGIYPESLLVQVVHLAIVNTFALSFSLFTRLDQPYSLEYSLSIQGIKFVFLCERYKLKKADLINRINLIQSHKSNKIQSN